MRARRVGDDSRRFPPRLAELIDSGARAEHRSVSLAFIQIRDVDRLAARDRTQLSRIVGKVFDAIAMACERFGLLHVETDVHVDAIKILLAAGLPDATEDDQERLLHGARLVVAADPGRVRAGAHVGLVYCGPVGHPRRRTYTAMGDAVNLAARLMGTAPSGTVLASRDLLDCVPGRFAIDWLEPFSVKGRHAVQTAAVVGDPLPHAADGGGVPLPRPPLGAARLGCDSP